MNVRSSGKLDLLTQDISKGGKTAESSKRSSPSKVVGSHIAPATMFSPLKFLFVYLAVLLA